MSEYKLQPIGVVHSILTRLEQCPKQGSEGAPEAWLEIDSSYTAGLEGIRPGLEVIVLTWLHQAQRDLLQVHPRGDPSRPLTGVFATRSPHRPNPIGLHRVTVLAIEGNRVRVSPLEALDGTPVVDLKPVIPDRRDD